MKNTLPTLLFVVFASTAVENRLHAQVPPGQGVRFSQSNQAPGIEFIDVIGGSGVAVPVTGLPANRRDFNGGILDPVTGDLYAVGSDNVGTAGVLFRIELNGNAVQALIPLVDTGSTYSLSSSVFDRDGNIFIHDLETIWRVDRNSGALTLWDTQVAGQGAWNSLTVDRERNLMWTVSCSTAGLPGSVIQEYDLELGPGPGTVIFDGLANGWPTCPTGIDHDENGVLYVSTFLFSGDVAALFQYDTNNGTAMPVPGGPNHSLNDVWYDRQHGHLHMTGAITSTAWERLDLSTGTLTLIQSGFGGFFTPVTSAIALNDTLHRTTMFPHQASSAIGATIEVAAHGLAGEQAAVLMTSLNGSPLQPPRILASGSCDDGGYFTLTKSFAPGALPANTTVGITAGVLDSVSGLKILGEEKILTILP
ncbi:MAG: hypothetical protein DWQ01_04415 [Planctomycetota bacterium]|nr:MAG: hypothetical protein DWQ01_04415 [Planctomycetota bacterium]